MAAAQVFSLSCGFAENEAVAAPKHKEKQLKAKSFIEQGQDLRRAKNAGHDVRHPVS